MSYSFIVLSKEAVAMVDYAEKVTNMVIKSNQINHFKEFKNHELGISSFSFDRESTIATASFDKTIKLYDINKNELKQSLSEHQQGVWACNFKGDNKNILASGSSDGKIFIWDLKAGKAVNKINFHNQTIYDVKYSKNGNFLAGCSKGMISIWDSKKPIKTFFYNKRREK